MYFQKFVVSDEEFQGYMWKWLKRVDEFCNRDRLHENEGEFTENVSKYARNQASGFVTYSLKKGGYYVFKKKVGGLYWVTWVTFSIKSIKSILLI
jgi:hypothetical protein